MLQCREGLRSVSKGVIIEAQTSKMKHERVKPASVSPVSTEMNGSQCILSCAEVHKISPKQNYTSCLAMDGAKILASGFGKDEKVKIAKLVNSMGGILHSKASSDVSFVIAKSVLAAKYKWAHNYLKKPVVSLNWLYQCWNEHRIVPLEPFRILPFTGLTICASRISAEERKAMEKIILKNGGKYSPDLTRKCTHLVTDAPEGDKYRVAKRWGNISIVTPKWIEQSVARKVCLDAELFLVHETSVPATDVAKSTLKRNSCMDKFSASSQTISSQVVVGPEVTLSQTTCSDANNLTNEASEASVLRANDEDKAVSNTVADDSQNEDDLYLSDCRVSLAGFPALEVRKLVKMLYNGGATRHISLNEKLTHIIVGSPSEIEWAEIRRLATWGIVKVVKPMWLEECSQLKREIAVSERHLAYSSYQGKGMIVGDALSNSNSDAISFKEHGGKTGRGDQWKSDVLSETPAKLDQLAQHFAVGVQETNRDGMEHISDSLNYPTRTLSGVFKNRLFSFSNSFFEDRRAEVAEWIAEGGGLVINAGQQNAHFIVECHGVKRGSKCISQSTIVSSHWIRFCLEEGQMPDPASHILFSPLPCEVPLRGFDGYRFCVSQYQEKERLLLRNLCFVLGAKFTEKLSKRVTHLICMFTSGPKYEAACKWGVEAVTADWINECVKQDKVVDLFQFRPKPGTSDDKEAGCFTVSQFLTQVEYMASGNIESHPCNQHKVLSTVITGEFPEYQMGRAEECLLEDGDRRCQNNHLIGGNYSKSCKKPRHIKATCMDLHQAEIPEYQTRSGEEFLSNDSVNRCHSDPNVACAIEDYLELSTRNEEWKSPVNDHTRFSPDRSIPSQDHVELLFEAPKPWLNRTEHVAPSVQEPVESANKCLFDGFTETQTESQVVVYENDVSGMQRLIESCKMKTNK